MSLFQDTYDVIVVGAGHAGSEAAASAAGRSGLGRASRGHARGRAAGL